MTSHRQKANSGREAQGDFYYDLAKLTFGGIVIGEILMLRNDMANVLNWATVVFGLLLTGLFAALGVHFYKKNNVKRL